MVVMDMVVMVTELELLVTQLEPHSLPEAHKDSVERDPPKLMLTDTVMDVVELPIMEVVLPMLAQLSGVFVGRDPPETGDTATLPFPETLTSPALELDITQEVFSAVKQFFTRNRHLKVTIFDAQNVKCAQKKRYVQIIQYYISELRYCC